MTHGSPWNSVSLPYSSWTSVSKNSMCERGNFLALRMFFISLPRSESVPIKPTRNFFLLAMPDAFWGGGSARLAELGHHQVHPVLEGEFALLELTLLELVPFGQEALALEVFKPFLGGLMLFMEPPEIGIFPEHELFQCFFIHSRRLHGQGYHKIGGNSICPQHGHQPLGMSALPLRFLTP